MSTTATRNKIIQYYLLCTVRNGKKRHIINELPKDKINIVVTRKEMNLYFRQQDGYYVPKEVVVGGNGGGDSRRDVIVVI